MRTFNQWARGAARNRATPMTEATVIYRDAREKMIAVSDGTTEEHIDKSTGEIREREKWTWLPKSQIRFEDVHDLSTLVPGKAYTLWLPEWLAKDRKLI
jgi:hypothetical protein